MTILEKAMNHKVLTKRGKSYIGLLVYWFIGLLVAVYQLGPVAASSLPQGPKKATVEGIASIKESKKEPDATLTNYTLKFALWELFSAVCSLASPTQSPKHVLPVMVPNYYDLEHWERSCFQCFSRSFIRSFFCNYHWKVLIKSLIGR